MHYTRIEVPGSPFLAVVTVTNTGASVDAWSLGFAYTGGQRVAGALGAVVRQQGATVTLTGGRLRRNQTAVVGIVATNSAGLANAPPELFRLNGMPC